jgi:hypothetical protein
MLTSPAPFGCGSTMVVPDAALDPVVVDPVTTEPVSVRPRLLPVTAFSDAGAVDVADGDAVGLQLEELRRALRRAATWPRPRCPS